MSELVLFSGGIDSTFALTKALQTGNPVMALHLSQYPHLKQENRAVGDIFCHLGQDLNRLIFREVRLPAPDSKGFIRGRNLVFLLEALSLVAETPLPRRVWAGFMNQTQDGKWAFPDQRTDYIRPWFEFTNLCQGNFGRRRVELMLPAAHRTKFEIVQEMKITYGEELILKTVSCWKGTKCGECPPCLQREEALERCRIFE